MPNGIVVDHKESGIRYAISERNFNKKIHEKVRDLKPGETVLGYTPKRKPSEAEEKQGTPETPDPEKVDKTQPHTEEPKSGLPRTSK
jgi:hypothetical protein